MCVGGPRPTVVVLKTLRTLSPFVLVAALGAAGVAASNMPRDRAEEHAPAAAPDQKAASDRLMKNQEDLHDALAPYYGKAAARKFTSPMKEHIGTAVDLIRAAKANDKARVQEADKRWNDNAEQIAQFLSESNPQRAGEGSRAALPRARPPLYHPPMRTTRRERCRNPCQSAPPNPSAA